MLVTVLTGPMCVGDDNIVALASFMDEAARLGVQGASDRGGITRTRHYASAVFELLVQATAMHTALYPETASVAEERMKRFIDQHWCKPLCLCTLHYR